VPAKAAAPAAANLAPDASRQPADPLPPRPVITVVGAGAARDSPPAVERALAGPSARRGDVRAGRVTVIPGGHRPGKPDLLQRDRARAQLPIDGSARIVVLGCTVGAGQTMTTLLLGDVLASLRSDRVAVIDLNPGASSLASRAEARPALSQAALTGRSRLAVIGPQPAPGADHGDGSGPFGGPRDPGVDAVTFEAATGRYDLVLADPASATMPRLLAVADQLVLVAPASGAAPGAIAMTFEWLDVHGRADLAAESIMVLNGVSRRSVSHVEQAERVCAGRCRAIVRVPWDDQLQNQMAKRTPPGAPGSQARQHWAGILSPATASAYTALAGVLVARLAGQDHGIGSEDEPAHAGRRAEP
jgi:MinD-like ATPase involved in chromosome partitioning or flagellar assembly